MLESRRSLASYFDEPRDVSAVHDWHDQTEADAHLAAPRDGQGFPSVVHQGLDEMSEDENEFSEDGLGADRLGEWMMHPKHAKPVWVPTGEVDVFNIPSGMVYQEKGNETWRTDMWGHDDHKARYDHSKKAKEDRKGETKEQRKRRLADTKDERAARRKQNMDTMTKARGQALRAIVQQDMSPYVDQNILAIMASVEPEKMILQKRKNDAILQAKARYGSEAGKSKKIDMAVHALKANILETFRSRGGQEHTWQSMLNEIDAFVKKNNLENIVGTELPTHDPTTGDCFLMVYLKFLGQMKKQIMTAFLKICRDKMKAMAAGSLPNNLYKFVNASNLANELRKRNVKARYPSKSKKFLPDATAMDDWDKHVRALERAAYKKIHPNGKLPKRLREDRPKNKGKKGKGGHGAGHGGGGTTLVINGVTVTLPGNQRGNGNNGKKGKGGKKHHKTYNPTYGHPPNRGASDYDPNNPPMYDQGAGPTYKYMPDGQAPRFMRPGQREIPYGAESRMQRGYFY